MKGVLHTWLWLLGLALAFWFEPGVGMNVDPKALDPKAMGAYAENASKLTGGGMFAPNYIENKLKFFQHIKEVVCFGNGRDFVTAFVNIDLEAVGNWAERKGMAYAGYTDLACQPQVYELIRECVEKVNADLASDPNMSESQIKRFLVLHKELDADDGELTRTRKVRRNFVAEKYKVLRVVAQGANGVVIALLVAAMEVWSWVRDEGRPLGAGDQEPVPNHRELLS